MGVLDPINNDQHSPEHRHGLAKAKAGGLKELGDELRKRKSETQGEGESVKTEPFSR